VPSTWVTKVALFGSMVCGEETSESDIDLLVEFSQHKSLLTLVRLERELAQALGRKVDVLTEAALSPYLRPQILQEMRIIYEA
jgi:predicted nucleotidyltransferase